MRKVLIEELSDDSHLITVFVDDEEIEKYGAGKFSSVVTRLRQIFKDKVKARGTTGANNTVETSFTE